MGTPEFASISLKSLIDNGFNIIGVFTNPDKPSGRGMKLKESEVKVLAKEYNLPVYQPLKLRNNDEVKGLLESLNPDLVIVVAYGKILPKYILEYPKLGCINVHGSLLPKYRGAAPIQWAIINGESKTGITTMYMDEGMDTGDMIYKKEITLEIEDTYGSLHDKLKKVGSELLIKTVEDILKGNI
jgi:methionyl-tRNA formyltransferase